jgi:hypothetical protein
LFGYTHINSNQGKKGQNCHQGVTAVKHGNGKVADTVIASIINEFNRIQPLLHKIVIPVTFIITLAYG